MFLFVKYRKKVKTYKVYFININAGCMLFTYWGKERRKGDNREEFGWVGGRLEYMINLRRGDLDTIKINWDMQKIGR